jgi:hypothetical protein
MTNNEILLQLIEHANAGKHAEFNYIRNWTDYRLAKRNVKALQYTVNALQTSCDRTFNTYCQEVRVGTADVTKLLAYTTLRTTLEFYKQELSIFTNMIYEYEAYLLEGNYVYAFFGAERTDDELWDFRE